jgi:hypothetical protein
MKPSDQEEGVEKLSPGIAEGLGNPHSGGHRRRNQDIPEKDDPKNLAFNARKDSRLIINGWYYLDRDWIPKKQRQQAKRRWVLAYVNTPKRILLGIPPYQLLELAEASTCTLEVPNLSLLPTNTSRPYPRCIIQVCASTKANYILPILQQQWVFSGDE